MYMRHPSLAVLMGTPKNYLFLCIRFVGFWTSHLLDHKDMGGGYGGTEAGFRELGFSAYELTQS